METGSYRLALARQIGCCLQLLHKCQAPIQHAWRTTGTGQYLVHVWPCNDEWAATHQPMTQVSTDPAHLLRSRLLAASQLFACSFSPSFVFLALA